jgi:rhodanese-related sulfurtransferase
LSERGVPAAEVPPGPQAEEISPAQLAQQLDEPGTVVLDFTTSANFVARHIPGAWWLTRSQLRQALDADPSRPTLRGDLRQQPAGRYAVPEVAALTGKPVQVLPAGRWRGSPPVCRWRMATAASPSSAVRPLSSSVRRNR